MSEIVTHRRTRQLKGQLTDLNLRNLTTRERPYKVADGNGLHVLVSPTGLRAWRWKYRFAGREKVLPLGRYPEVSLAEARAARDEARKKVMAGIDPGEERRDAKLALLSAQENSFEVVARAWHKVWAEGKHARYAEDVMRRLERNVFPSIGHKPVDQIEPKDIVRMMERIHGRGANDIARRVRNTCSQIFRYPEHLVQQVVRQSNALMTMAGMLLALLGGRQEAVTTMKTVQRPFAHCLLELLTPTS